MAQWLTLSRAAHLIGRPRGALQQKIHDGELAAFDGMVSTDDLRRAFPDLDLDRALEDGGAFERTVKIKDEAFAKRVRERLLPSQEILSQRLFAQGQELAALRRHLALYHDLVEALRSRISSWEEDGPSPALQDLGRHLDNGLAAILGSPDNTDAIAIMDDMLRVISARVTLKPSGREFLVEGSDTLLAAALKAGASPNYGCGAGNCGLCKARLVSGEVRRVRASDYVLSEAERQQGCFLMCANTAVSDVVVEALEAGTPADIPEQSLVAKVRALNRVGDTLLLHLQTPRTHRLRFLAGQSAALGVAGGMADFGGEYPIASCPCDDRNLHFHLRRAAADPFVERLFAGAVKIGDPVSVHGPRGDFVLGDGADRPLVFIAAGTGFAPVKGLIEHAIASEAAPSISLCWTATPGGHYLGNQGRAWADALDHFRYVELDAGLDGEAAASATAEFDAGQLSAADVFVAGPPDFVAAATARLADAPRLKTLVT